MAVAVTSANNHSTFGGARLVFRNSSGIPYILVSDQNVTDERVEMWKGNGSTPTSFTQQDTAGEPTSTVTVEGISGAIDSTGIIHIIMQDKGSASLFYVTYNTSTDTWGTATEIDADSDPTLAEDVYVDIAVDSNDIPHIVYSQAVKNMGTDYNTVTYGNRVGGTWNFAEVEGQNTSKQCKFCAIAINNSNIPVVSYINVTDSTLSRGVGNVNNATSFTITDLDTSVSTTNCTSITFDTDGNSIISAVDSDGSVIVYENTTARDTGITGTNPSVAVNSNDIYVFYEDSNNDIVYNVYTSSWSGPLSLETGTYNSVRVSRDVYSNSFDYVFVDETASPDVQWGRIQLTNIPTVINTQTYQSGSGGFLSTHTWSDVNVSGTNTIHLACGINRNPASEVSGWTSDGNSMTSVVDSINANVCAVSIYRYLINNADVTTVSSTPTFKLQGGFAIGAGFVDQTTPIAGNNTSGGFGSTASVSYTGTRGNLLMVFVSTQNDKTYTAYNCNSLASVTHADSSCGSGFVGYLTANGSSQTLGCSWTTDDNWRIAVIELAYSASGGGGSVIKTVDGVAIASVKTIDGVAIASVKTRDGVSNV